MNQDSVVSYPGQFRPHVGLAVSDLKRSIEFYSILFDQRPVKEKPGYAKFEPTDPSLNLSLNEVSKVRPQNRETHFGIQVKSAKQFADFELRIRQSGLPMRMEKQTSCCYAVQDKFWIADPDGVPWEVFLVTNATSEIRKSSDACCEPGCCQEDAEAVPTGAANATSPTNS